MTRILFIDDEENVLRALKRVIERKRGTNGLSLECFSNPELAMDRIRTQTFNVIVSDYRMAPVDGVSVLMLARETQPSATRMILSAQADMDVLVRAINEAQIFRFLAKPWDDEEIWSAIDEAIDANRRTLEAAELADAQRLQLGALSASEVALRKLEREAPAIANVRWGPNGEVLLDDDRDEE